jgi:hypothetical protein
MRRIYEIDCQNAVLSVGESPVPHLVKMIVRSAQADPVDVLIGKDAFAELCSLQYRLDIKEADPAYDNNERRILSLAASA